MVKDGVLGVVGDVLGDQALHGGYHGHVVVGVGLGDQGVYLAAHIGPVIFTDTGDASSARRSWPTFRSNTAFAAS